MSGTRKMSKRQCLLVLGMHRSGTSLLAGILSKLGAQPPRHLMNPQGDNPLGFWESTELWKLHEEILEATGSAWNDWGPFDRTWQRSSAMKQFYVRLATMIELEYGDADLFVVKDPRICRFVPLWLRALEELNATPKVVIALRHPIEIVQSLEARNEYGERRVLLMWLRHFLDAEASTRHVKRVFVQYADVIEDWRVQMARISATLDVRWPHEMQSVEESVEAFLHPELRHHHVVKRVRGKDRISDWVGKSYDAALVLASSSGSRQDKAAGREAMATLDVVKREFDESSALYGPVAVESETIPRRKWKTALANLTDRTQELGKVSAKLKLAERAGKEREELLARQARAHEAEHAKALEERDKKCAALEKELTTMRRTLAKSAQDAEEKLASLRNKMQASENLHVQRYREVSAELSQCRATMQEQRAMYAALSEDMSRRLSVAQDRASKLEDEIKRTASRAQEYEVDLARLRTVVTGLEDTLARNQKHMAESRARWQAMERKLMMEAEVQRQVLEGELGIYREIVFGYAAEIQAIRNSRLWKLGWFLRHGSRRPAVARPMASSVPEVCNVIKRSGLFAPGWYRMQYPDVAKHGIDPVEHYVRFGAKERRDPSPCFSTKDYLGRYPDVLESNENPLFHFITRGLKEGRVARSASLEGNGSGD